MIAIFVYYFFCYKVGYSWYSYFNPSNFYTVLAKKFYKIKNYILTLEKIFDVFQSNEDLYILFKDKLTHCRNLFVDRNGFTKVQNEMLELLKIIPAKWSYWKQWGKARPQKLCRFL